MGRIVLINLLVFICLLGLIEASARLFLYFTRGSSTAGLPERTLYLNYRPFVMFGPDWDAKFADQTIKKSPSVKRVLLIGGSTAALFPVNILEEALKYQFPEYDFKVINAAEGGYNARQEVVVAALWAPQLKPDIIISLDGANDLTHRLRMDKPGSFFLDAAYESALKKPLLSPFTHWLRYSQAMQGAQRLQERRHIGKAEQYADAVPTYIAAQHSINVLTKGLNAKRIMILQPFMAFKQPLSAQEKRFTHYQYREAVLMQLYEKQNRELEKLAKQDNVKYLDGRFIFQGIESTVFSDDVHFVNDKGYRVLAENIAKVLRKEGI